MEFEFLIDNILHRISLEKKENHYNVLYEGKSFEANILYITPNIISVLIEGHSYLAFLARDKDKRYVYVDGCQSEVQELSDEGEDLEEGGGKSQEDVLLVKAPMPGKVIKINVVEEEEVRKNQTLAIVEAMKMENEIKSSIEGLVKKIFVSAGDLVDSEKILIELGKKEE